MIARRPGLGGGADPPDAVHGQGAGFLWKNSGRARPTPRGSSAFTGQADLETSIAAVNTARSSGSCANPCATGGSRGGDRQRSRADSPAGHRGARAAAADAAGHRPGPDRRALAHQPGAFGHATRLAPPRPTSPGCAGSWTPGRSRSRRCSPSSARSRGAAGDRRAAVRRRAAVPEEEAAAARGRSSSRSCSGTSRGSRSSRGSSRRSRSRLGSRTPRIRRQGPILRIVYEHYLLEIRGAEAESAMQKLRVRGFERRSSRRSARCGGSGPAATRRRRRICR